MSNWIEFSTAIAAFLTLHAVPVRPAVKSYLVGRFGAPAFLIAYSFVSVLALAWLIVSAGRAPYVEIWEPAPWQSAVTLAEMVFVCVIVVLSIGRPNPFSFGGSGNGRFDPAKAGMVRVNRHPLLLALLLWSGAHILPNGDLAHLMMFGLFALFALIGMRLIDRRKKREIGPRRYQDRLAAMHRTPLAESFEARGLLVRLCAAAVLFALLLALHPAVIGVSPLAAIR